MIDFFTPWIKLQQQAIDFQKQQLEWAQKAMTSAGDMVSAQQAAQSAMAANMKAYESWASLWGVRAK
ncbi:hypothetical protein PQ455_01925 [Sphingomonas naphthae]|uniref:Phasin domain-containing protein n=1 Tax=Sphingomonas naphthae TaxID=1813468 RepID=A0ABY7TM10_9SPHN|nr:hypothetical protein [Sphingomonas naphthae]WCT74016.1 hypothetical protein PQ455_01925 [Sphingomonas naphthae]